MQTFLLAIELVVAVVMIIFVLLQRSEGGALGMGGGGSGLGGLFSPRGAADTLTRTTAILAAVFFVTCLALNLLSLHGRQENSLFDSPLTQANSPAQSPRALPPAAPAKGPSVPTPH